MMKQKAYALLGFLTVLVMAVSMASALTLTATQGVANSTTYTLTNNDSVEWTGITVTSLNSAFFAVSPVAIASLNSTNSTTITLTASNSLGVGSYSSSMSIAYNNGSAQTQIVPVTVNVVAASSSSNDTAIINSLCGGYTQSTSQIVLSSIENKDIDNEKDWQWKPLDNTEIELDVRNSAADNEDHDYDVELYLYNSGNDVTGDVVTDEDNLISEGVSIDNDRRETVNFAFQIDGQTEQYSSLAVWAVVKELDNNVCYAQKLDTAKVTKNSKQVVVKKVDTTTTVKAGETLSLDVEVANIGKQDEEKVKVNLYNKDLGLNLYKEIDNVNEGDTATTTFLVTIPATAKQGSYKLLLSTEYDYDSKDEQYDESDSDDDFTQSITVFGMTSAPTIGAKLISSATVGKTLQVDVSLTNNGDAAETYDVIVEGASWANNVKFASDSVVVKAGETQTVRLTLVPQEAGAQDFTIKAVYGDEIKKQTVSVNIASGSSIPNIFEGISTLGYLIGAIVVLAILILIVAIVKLAKPRRRVESIAY